MEDSGFHVSLAEDSGLQRCVEIVHRRIAALGPMLDRLASADGSAILDFGIIARFYEVDVVGIQFSVSFLALLAQHNVNLWVSTYSASEPSGETVEKSASGDQAAQSISRWK